MSAENHVEELLPAYVLGSLDKDDVVDVTDHLAICPHCRQELQEYQELVGELALAVPEQTPAPQVKQQLMAQVQQKQDEVASSDSGESTVVQTLQRHVAALTRRLAPAWTALSVILVLALSVSTFLLWQQVDELQHTQRGLTTIPLSGTEAAPDATGIVVMSLDGEHGTLVVDRLPQLDEEQQYQLWLIKDGERTDGGLFSVSDDGYSSLWVSAPDPLRTYTDFGITIEPAGGSPGPTGAKVLGTSS